MKNLVLILITTFTLSCCDKDDDKPKNPIDQLPPATQIGANTFGCLLDGKVFTPELSNNSFQCSYENISGEFYFYIRGSRRINTLYNSIYLLTKKKQIVQNETYDLLEYIDNNASGAHSTGITPFNTNSINTGKLSITKLDMQKQIVSGTFWFDVKDNKGVIHQIREGRFDMQFTQ